MRTYSTFKFPLQIAWPEPYPKVSVFQDQSGIHRVSSRVKMDITKSLHSSLAAERTHGVAENSHPLLILLHLELNTDLAWRLQALMGHPELHLWLEQKVEQGWARKILAQGQQSRTHCYLHKKKMASLFCSSVSNSCTNWKSEDPQAKNSTCHCTGSGPLASAPLHGWEKWPGEPI